MDPLTRRKDFYLYYRTLPEKKVDPAPYLRLQQLQQKYQVKVVVQIFDDLSLLSHSLDLPTLREITHWQVQHIRRYLPRQSLVFTNLNQFSTSQYLNLVKIQSHLSTREIQALTLSHSSESVGKLTSAVVEMASYLPTSFPEFFDFQEQGYQAVVCSSDTLVVISGQILPRLKGRAPLRVSLG